MKSPTPLKFLMPGWFTLVMGLSGLALAWRSAEPALGEMAVGVALLLGVLAAALFLLLAAASLLRWQRYPKALADDLNHPVRHAFVAAVPVSMLLLAAVALSLDLGGWAVEALWWAGSLVELLTMVWVMGRWLAPQSGASAQAGALWPGVTPVLFIAVVGNVVAVFAGVPLGHPVWSAAQFGIGVLFWPVTLALVMARRLEHRPLPDRLFPTWFITVAPPSLVGLALLQFQAPLLLVQSTWGVALFSLLWVGSQLRRLQGQAFGLPFWALSFPLAAFTTLTLRLGQAHGLAGLQTAGVLLLAAVSLVVLGLCLATWRGLRDGSLLAPEPVATIVPVSR